MAVLENKEGHIHASESAHVVSIPARLLRAEEVAEMTGWKKSKVYAMAAAGELPTIKSGRSVRVPYHAFVRWIQNNTVGGNHLG